VEEYDNWGFPNKADYFTEKYPKIYYMEEAHREALLEIVGRDNDNIEADLMKNEIYQPRYNGSCFGLSLLVMYNCYGIIQPSVLDGKSQHLQNVVLSDSVKSLINYHSLLQRTTSINESISSYFTMNAENQKLQDLLDSLEDGHPTLLCYTIPAEKLSHAVIAYGMGNDTYTFDGMTLEYDTKILIYDCNKSDFQDSYCMYVNTTRNSWYIPDRDVTEKECAILWVEDDIDVLTKYSIFTNSTVEDENIVNLASLETERTLDCKVKAVRKVNDDWFISSSDDEILSYYGFMSGDGTAPLRYVMYDMDANYQLSMNDEPQDIELQMRYADCLMRVNATETDNIVFQPNGLEMEGTSSAYTLHMVLNEIPNETSFHTIDVSGDSANKLTFSYENGEWYLFGDCLENIEVQANHSAATSNTLTFSVPTKYDTVCLRQMDDSTIAAFVDTNGDGEYETSVDNIPEDEGNSLGDVNTDGEVDSLDAANILIAAALVGANMDSGLSDAQKIAADTNKNGTFGAEDAALVLQYAAAIGSGYTGEFEEFLAA